MTKIITIINIQDKNIEICSHCLLTTGFIVMKEDVLHQMKFK